jgi:hypothetical protein
MPNSSTNVGEKRVRKVIALFFLLSSCGPNKPSNTNPDANENRVIDASTESSVRKQSFLIERSTDLPKCEGLMLGSLAYVRGESLFYACEQTGWVSVSIKGDPGAPGAPGAPGQKADSSSSNAVVWKTVKANGVVIGKTMESLTGIYDWVTVVTSKGYSFNLTAEGEMLKSPWHTYYSSVDCSGDMYMMANWNVRGTTSLRGENLYYIARDAQLQKGITIRSLRTSTTFSCTAYDYTEAFKEYFFVKEVSNDPAITGVSSSSFQLPITVE